MMKFLMGLMTFLVAAAMLALPVPAHAASLVYQAEGITIVLKKEPCTDEKTLSIIEEPYRANFFAADITYKGKPLKGCWMPVPQSFEVLMADETGDHGAIPMSAFQRRDDL